MVLGHHIARGAQATVECAPKWPGDAGGSPFLVDGKVQLVEQIRYPEDFNPDIVDVFRKPSDMPGVATEAVEIGASVFWGQLGLHSDEAVDIAHGAGLDVVMDRCLKIEHARFSGGLNLAGFDTGVISSRRRR